MLENFTSTVISDNRPLDLEEEREGIVRGATCSHLFKLPLDIAEIKDFKVSYKQGLHVILEKKSFECFMEVLEDDTHVKAILDPADSRLFNSYNKDTTVQIALILQDDTIIYSPLYSLIVLDTINDDAFGEENIE